MINTMDFTVVYNYYCSDWFVGWLVFVFWMILWHLKVCLCVCGLRAVRQRSVYDGHTSETPDPRVETERDQQTKQTLYINAFKTHFEITLKIYTYLYSLTRSLARLIKHKADSKKMNMTEQEM